MAIGDKYTCANCGHEWNTRVEVPVQCPRCTHRLQPRQRGGWGSGSCPHCGRTIGLNHEKRIWVHRLPGSPGRARPVCEGSGERPVTGEVKV
jgi:DNA-directed RNA polymerase subunit RPC12/RpoP